MSNRRTAWYPAAVLLVGCVLLIGVRAQLEPQLRGPLDSALPVEFDGLAGLDMEVSDAEAQVAGFTDYALRVYQHEPDTVSTATAQWVSVYLGFYDRQTRGKTIHSPKNCLPGGGWEPLASTVQPIELPGGGITVNRYLLQNRGAQALVLYWYQGRGRVAHNEYLVKWDLLRDAVLKRRTDEALVRIVVPVLSTEEAAFEVARNMAQQLKPAVDEVLPL